MSLNTEKMLWTVLVAVAMMVLLRSGLVAQPATQPSTELQRTLEQARNLERLNRYEEAFNIHLRLYQRYPDNIQVLTGLERNLLQLERYEDLIQFLRDQLAGRPDDPSLLEKLGSALYKAGQQEEAERTWQRIITLNPDKPDSYEAVARQYLYNGLVDQTVETYLQGRERLGDPALFAREMANLYTSRMEQGKAAEEYIRLLESNPKQFAFVENMLSRFKEEGGEKDGVAAVLEEAVRSHPENPLFRRLLGACYLRLAEPEDAFEQFLSVENIEQTGGATLLEFGDWSHREGFFAAAITSYQHLLEQYPESLLIPKAYQGLGQSLSKLGRHREAITVFRRLKTEYPKSKEAEYGLFEIGRIQLKELAEPDSALIAFNELVSDGRHGSHYFEAIFLSGECHLVKNDLLQAERRYQQARDEAQKAPPVAEEAAFRMAEMKYFRGDFDGALKELGQTIQSYPRGMFTNDAIALMVFIEENRFFGDDPLKAFTMGALLERQGKADEAVSAYQRIGTYYPRSFVVDDAILRIGSIQRDQGNFEAAIETFRGLLEKQPDCDVCDEIQRSIGEIYELNLNDLPKAIEAYEELLSRYPDSLLYDATRKKIRELQAQVGGTG